MSYKKESNKKYRDSHREEYNAYMREYKNNLYHTNEEWRLNYNSKKSMQFKKTYENDPEFAERHRAKVRSYDNANKDKKKAYYLKKKSQKLLTEMLENIILKQQQNAYNNTTVYF